jgi:polyphenol oxidase
MFTDDEGASRRDFLQKLGVGAAGIWFAGRIPTVSYQPGNACAPPTHGAATPFRRDCRPIRPRQVANRLTPAEVTQLKSAYQAMRALDTSDPNDPRGFTQQANVHCFWCATTDPTVQVHGSWKFFAWHRAYLYFHERILGNLIGNENFRLPFWGWDSPGFTRLPNPYVTPNNSTNPLYNSTRFLAAGTPLPDEDIGTTVINSVLGLASFPEFGGTATTSGVPEGSPHGSVHVDVGGNMGAFSTAARDPVFYQHHATVDKLWSDWEKGSATHANPTDAAFRDLTFTFFDENKVWRSITAAQVLDHERSLRYVYEPYRFWDIFPCFIWRPLPFGWRTNKKIVIPKGSVLAATLSAARLVRLHFVELQVPRDRSAVYRIYGNQAEAQADAGPTSPAYLGNVGVVLNDPDNKHPIRGTVNVIVTLKPPVRAALARGEALTPLLVDRDEKAGSKRAIPVSAADVIFSVGEPDHEK